MLLPVGLSPRGLSGAELALGQGVRRRGAMNSDPGALESLEGPPSELGLGGQDTCWRRRWERRRGSLRLLTTLW